MRTVFGNLAYALLACAIAEPLAWADDRQEYVAELDVYHKLSAQTRLFLTASATDAESTDSIKAEGGAYLDITLKGELRERLHLADWARSRPFWIRVGYTQLRTWDGQFEDVSERRGVLQLSARAGSWHGFHLTHRAGVDFRDLNGTSSQRYRYRLDVEREMKARDIVVIPYVRAEVFYDTRYSSCSKQSYQAGAEIDLSKHWRLEPYFAMDRDSQPSVVYTHRLGVLGKFYW
jgi:hypothetical protein